jgi:hypothetical protein
MVEPRDWHNYVVICRTRYGGVYEGGPWAAFLVGASLEKPGVAFAGGDTDAVEWWWEPTELVGVGDDPNEALARLEDVRVQAKVSPEVGASFSVGDIARVASCAPDYWHPGGEGLVERRTWVEFERPNAAIAGRWDYSLTVNGEAIEVPEPYLRRRR